MRISILSFLLMFVGYNVFCQSATENYVVTKTYQKETLNPISQPTPKVLLEEISYIDGLGRIKQIITRYGGGDKENLITPVVYDIFGRQAKNYLPYARAAGNGAIVLDPLSEVSTFYNTFKYENTLNPYSEIQFESSPLNRIEKQAAPGNDWAMGSGHEIEFGNQSNGTEDQVRLFRVEFPTGDTAAPSLGIEAQEFYGAGQLYKAITRDEQHSGVAKNHSTEEYKDKQGRVVLKRTYADVNSNTELEVWHDTYYVYDNYGNLTYVLPPKMDASTATLASITGNMNALGYQYKYDYRNRLIEKQIPGKGEEFIIYNILDQPVLSQDANQSLTNKWLYTKYDAFGRVVSTGIYTHPSKLDQTTMQLQLNNHYAGSTPPKLYEEKSGPSYTNRSFPTTGLETLTENYYDDYNFDLAGLSIPAAISDGTSIEQTKAKGLVTGSKVKVLETQDWKTTINGYDRKGRVIWSGSKNTYLDTEDTSETILNFTGNVLKSTATHTKEGQAAAIVVEGFYNYDHMGRMLKHTQSINGASEQLIAENTYDELGQLVKKGVGYGRTSNSLEEINTQTAFTDIAGVAVDAVKGLLFRNGEVSYKGWDSGASTLEKLTGDGYFEFSSNASKHYAIGLSYENVDHTPETMAYGIRGFNDRTIRIYENGIDQGVVFQDDGILRMVRKNNIIKYYQKGTLIYTSNSPVIGDLIGDIALHSNGATAIVYNMHNEGEVDHIYEGVYKEIKGMRMFDQGLMIKNSGSLNSANLRTFASFNGNGKIEFTRRWSSDYVGIRLRSKKDSTYYQMGISSGTIKTGANGNSKFTGNTSVSNDVLSIERKDNKILYKKNGVEFSSETTTDYDDLYAEIILGEHGSQIDSINVINDNDFVDLNRKTMFTNNFGVIVTDSGALKRDDTVPYGTLTGVSTTNKISGDGYFEFTLQSDRYSMMAGLSHQDTDYSYTSIEFGLLTSKVDSNVRVYENGVDIGVQTPHTGVLRVERIGNEIHYKQNGVTFHISSNTVTGDLIGDVSFMSGTGSMGIVQLYDYSLLSNYTSSANFEDIVNLEIGENESISKSKADGWNTELATKSSILKSGELGFSPTFGNKELIAGLSYQKSIADPLTINYGIKLFTDGNVRIFEHGKDLGIKTTYTAADDFKIERTGYEITYLKNEIVFYTSSSLAFHPLFGDLSIYSSGGGLDYITIIETEALNGYLQEIDYAYNIRGWLIQINDPSNLGEDLFGYGINYNKPNLGATPLFNGNISETHWSSLSENSSSNLVSNQYRYSYDALNRITEAIDNTTNYNLSGITYDKMGNILSLQRQGQINADASLFGNMDQLAYSYDTGNKLMQVDDLSSSLEGFKDGNSGVDYGYDSNGNMTSDLNKGIMAGGIKYNHLNLPTEVKFNNSTSQLIKYTYDATGVKLRKEIPGKTTDYAGGFVYEQLGTGSTELQFFNHPEGYVEYDGSSFNYVYNYVDHLGNVRLSYTDGDGNGSIDLATEIIQEKNYYPFGLTHQGYNNGGSSYGNAAAKRYGFGGKELQDETFSGNILDWYDFGARNYDPSLGRWMNIDNKAEKYYDNSTYTYVLNHPTIFVDPDGQEVIWGEGLSAERKEEIGSLVYQLRKNSKVFNTLFEKLHSAENKYSIGGTEGESQLGMDAVVIPNSELGDMIGEDKYGMAVWGEGTAGATMDIYFGQLKKDNLKLQDVLAEEFVHLYQQQFYVGDGSFDYEKKPAGVNTEYEAKSITGFIKKQANISFNNNGTGWAENRGLGYFNNPRNLKIYSQDMQNWVNLPDIQKTSYSEKAMNLKSLPSLLINIINSTEK